MISANSTDFSLFHGLFSAFGFSFMAVGFLKLISDLIIFVGPVLLHSLIICLEDIHCTDSAYLYSLLLVLSSFISSVLSSNFQFYVSKIGLQIRSSISIACFKKLLNVRLSRLSSFKSGELLNFVSSDVDRVVNFCGSFHSFWSLPLQLAITLYLLYREVGIAFLSGLISSIVLIAINKFIMIKIGQFSVKMMYCKDQRIKLVNEMVHSIRAIKLSNWEKELERRIMDLRNDELRYLSARKYLDAICVYLWACAPVLLTIAIFSTYTVILQQQISTAKLFTCLALVNLLIMPLNAFPWVMNGIIEAYVSLKRLNKLFNLEQIDQSKIYSLTSNDCELIGIDNAIFCWTSDRSVGNISITGNKGLIIGIIGPVGCGKTTFLLGILGEVEMPTGIIRLRADIVQNGFAYLPQSAWLNRGSIRENIIADANFNADFYWEVIYATALDVDLQTMPGGDSYEVGDNGRMLSGGQRMRVALARALYQDKNIYLLDDPFASLDQHVARHVWDYCIVKLLRNRSKIVIIASHDTTLLKMADETIILDSTGRVTASGRASDLLQHARRRLHLTTTHVEKAFQTENLSCIQIDPERKEEGGVRSKIYREYVKAAGVILAVVNLITFFLMQLSKNFSDWWLTQWSSSIPNSSNISFDYRMNEFWMKRDYEINDWSGTKFYLLVYVCIATGNTFFTLLRAFFFALGGIRAAKNLHSKLLSAVLQAPMVWWDSVPSGRIINRLCADTYTIDDSLPFQFNILLAASFNMLGSALVTSLSLPTVIPALFILFIVYYLIQRIYRYTTCEVRRFVSLTLSPLYSMVSETISGLATIRAFRFNESFTQRFRDCIGDNIRAQYSTLASSLWLTVRLQFLGTIMILVITLVAVFQHSSSSINAGLTGLLITYALTITNLLNSLLVSFVETEKELICVERVVEYVQEAPKELNNGKIMVPKNLSGYIEFKRVSMKYSEDSLLVLRKITFRVKIGNRIAVIGRTGSGKTSLFQALLRISPISCGEIFVGNIDIYAYDLYSFRSLFGVVPQTPFVFSGTLRENLLFCKDYSVALLNRLTNEEGSLKRIVEKLGGLDADIQESGENLSFGEKQVISVCRILLAQPHIVILDEATAHLDHITLNEINRLLRDYLPKSTIFSIMHRMEMLEDFDYIIQIARGNVIWEGSKAEMEAFYTRSHS